MKKCPRRANRTCSPKNCQRRRERNRAYGTRGESRIHELIFFFFFLQSVNKITTDVTTTGTWEFTAKTAYSLIVLFLSMYDDSLGSSSGSTAAAGAGPADELFSFPFMSEAPKSRLRVYFSRARVLSRCGCCARTTPCETTDRTRLNGRASTAEDELLS